ncbi:MULTISPECIES: hypothetical protein [Halorussus]|uniref:hypothetical protein n=1 Tax=Halorussus TaxID=1070314 RepID=UPI00209FC47E|nr:hypothetical protein [Halorussus vallis]USZ74467.1 hypothetical protein NGM07_13555 [Halorussus vallis]
MVWSLVLGSVISALAGLTMAFTTALLTDHREKRQWLRTKVYQPLYGELTEVISGEIPGDGREYSSLWADFGYYKTHSVDSELADALDGYASHVSELSGRERRADVDAFVAALPDYVCEDGDAVAELPSGRTVDVRTWLKRNLVVLSTAPSFRAEAFGFDPADLDYLWAEVDDLSADDVRGEPFDTAEALEAVSKEFNWGYEALYHRWNDGWAEDLAAALLAAVERPGSDVQAALLLRRDVGATASELKRMIRDRTDVGLFRSLWDDWNRRRIR